MKERSERRKERREKVMAFTQVYDKDKGMLLGHIRDLTQQGALVIGEQALDVNTQIALTIELPGGLPGVSATHMTISARVVYCEEDESSQTYKTGFEFIGLKPEQSEHIQALLERYRFHQ